jgi:hypothetical protein
VGVGSQYGIATLDADREYLDGTKNYKLHLPPDVPARNFWSVMAYDPQTRSMLQTDQQFPGLNNMKGVTRLSHRPVRVKNINNNQILKAKFWEQGALLPSQPLLVAGLEGTA